MSNMKYSGVEWIGYIPYDWHIQKLKNIGNYINGYAFKPENWGSQGKPIIRIQDLTKSNNNPNYFLGEIDSKYLVKNGDILVSWAATLDAFIWNKGEGWLNQHIFKAIPNEKEVDSKYFYWLLKVVMNFMNNDKKHGIVMQHVTIGVFNNYKIVLPPIDLQYKISCYLNVACSNVDKLIKNQDRQIENIKAYKQSLITETVNKGLNPDVQTNDSGVDWIGQINKKYNTVPINSLFTIKKNIIGKDPECVLSITQQGLKIKDISQNNGQMAQSYEKYQIVNKGDFAMNHMDLLTGWVDISKYDGVTSPDYRVFTLKDKNMVRKYFLYVFQSYYKNKVFYGFGQGVSNMGRWRLPAVNFNKITIPVPPIEEQEKIVDYLDLKCNQIDKLIEIKQQKIEKLNEYKKSLIYEYVTGKKEVI